MVGDNISYQLVFVNISLLIKFIINNKALKVSSLKDHKRLDI
jgi:hypothetical protein